jgi:membrane protein involved in colicin uptake
MWRLLLGLLGGLTAGCAGRGLQDDGFRERLRRGCDSVEHCERLAADAEIRIQQCRPNTIGHIRCDDAQADLINARLLLTQHRREREERQQARLEQQRRERERALAVEKRTREREEAERQRMEKERQARLETEREAKATEQAILAEEQQKERLRLLGRSGRDRELRQCYKTGRHDCRALLLSLLSVAESEAEKRALVALDQQLAGGAL